MFSHVTLGTKNLDHAASFYDPLMRRLGLRRIESDAGHGLIGYGDSPEATLQFYLITPFDGGAASVGNGVTIAFEALDRATVDAFHHIALEHGGRCEGPLGLRPHYHPDYYGTYLRDPDGNKLCCVCHRPP